MSTDSNSFGGLFSFLAFVASAVFFGLELFSVVVGDINLIAAGLFSMALGFVLGRLGH